MSITKHWSINEKTFPKGESIEKQLKFLLKYAILSPSIYNIQPWKFEIIKNKINIIPDKSRRLPIVDSKNREFWISLGCSLENLILASEHFGFSNTVTISDKKIGITFKVSKKKQNILFDYITKRVTNKRRAKRMKVSKEVITQLKKLEFEKNINAYFFEEKDDLEKITKFVQGANTIQLKSERYVNELISWIRFNNSAVKKQKDGLTYYSMDIPFVNRALGTAIIKFFLKVKSINKEDTKKIKTSSGIILITSSGDAVVDWVKTGITLERILLELTSKGIAYSFINAPCRVNRIRKKVFKLVKAEPQLILRIGYAKTLSHSPRRELEDVMVDDKKY